MNQLTEDELMDTKLSLNRLTFPPRAADTITDNRLTLMSDTDKITDNRNQNFYAFSCTAECQRGSDVEIKDGLFVLYLCGSCLRCVALRSRSSSLLRDVSVFVVLPKISCVVPARWLTKILILIQRTPSATTDLNCESLQMVDLCLVHLDYVMFSSLPHVFVTVQIYTKLRVVFL